MTRLRQFSRGLGSSWLATLATVVYSLLSVPIALKYLSVDEFGLFVLLIQVSGYFTLIEIGMSAATSRILVDHKDRPDDGGYGSVILTGFAVFAVQAFVILAAGILAARWVVVAIGVPEEFVSTAASLLRWLAAASALTIGFRIYGSVLYANKRLDLIHGIMGGSMLLCLVLLAAILASGAGLAGLAWVFAAQSVATSCLFVFSCHQLKLLPKKGCWGKPSLKRFRELFGFGKDIFLVNVGNQLLEASQLIIVTRTMGLTAAAVWSVSTKLFALVYQLINKIGGTAVVFFAEMMVRGEVGKLATRFRQVYQLTAGTAIVALAVAVAINRPFVSAWAEPSLAWSLGLSGLMAAYVLLNALTRCSGDLIIHTKNIAGFRYVYFAEAIAFVALALWLGSRSGFYGVLAASISCLVLFRGIYTTWRIARYFEIDGAHLWWKWLKRPLTAALILAPFALTAGWVSGCLRDSWVQLVAAAVWVGFPAAAILLTVVLPRDVRDEFLRHRLPFIARR